MSSASSPSGRPAAALGAPRVLVRLGVLLLFGALSAVLVYTQSVRVPVTVPGLRLGGVALEGVALGGLPFGALESRVDAAVERYLDGTMSLRFLDRRIQRSRRELGVTIDRARLLNRLREAGKSGRPVADLLERWRLRLGPGARALTIDEDASLADRRALEALVDLKEEVDVAAEDAHLDLERHLVAPERPGFALHAYDALALLEAAVRAGRTTLDLPGREIPPRVRATDLQGIDISTVLGRWQTRYSAIGPDTDRTYNLKVGAEKLNGHMLKPGEIFSFNEVVGARTEKEGYRVAPVIQGGELIDGLAGGMCQIASTLHAAAFFAGLDIVASQPHSRPSSYIPMGLDSTVVYPSVDLKLKNAFEFPIVLHLSVNQGAVTVELLGRARPYRVVFEREIRAEHGFRVETRADPEAPVGQRYVVQEGYPGYSLLRRRFLFDAHKAPRLQPGAPALEALDAVLVKQRLTPLARQQWSLSYPSTTQIVALGTGPATLKRKPPPPSHRIPPVPASARPLYRLTQP